MRFPLSQILKVDAAVPLASHFLFSTPNCSFTCQIFILLFMNIKYPGVLFVFEVYGWYTVGLKLKWNTLKLSCEGNTSCMRFTSNL